MSSPARRPPPVVIDQLLATPQSFGFFQAVRLLDVWLSEGRGAGVGLERLHFRNSLSLSFPASEIESLHAQWRTPEAVSLPANLARVDMTPACMGLLGVSGALPLFYTEWLGRVESQRKDASARAFLEVFSHRAVMLFYQAWRKHRMAVRYEADRQKAFLPQVLALAGFGLKGLRHRLEAPQGGVADDTLAYFAGTLQQRTLPMGQVQGLLQRHLGVPVRMVPFVGRWYPVPESGRTHLGARGQGMALGGVLGRSALLGERVWQRHLRVAVEVGPLSHRRFLDFLPGGTGARALRHWLTLLHGPALEYEVRVQLRQPDVRTLRLASDRPAAEGRLGWDSFMLTRPAVHDRRDVCYDLEALA